MAAVVALLARDLGGPALAAQVLIYPGTDATFALPGVTRAAGQGLAEIADHLAESFALLWPARSPYREGQARVECRDP